MDRNQVSRDLVKLAKQLQTSSKEIQAVSDVTISVKKRFDVWDGLTDLEGLCEHQANFYVSFGSEDEAKKWARVAGIIGKAKLDVRRQL